MDNLRPVRPETKTEPARTFASDTPVVRMQNATSPRIPFSVEFFPPRDEDAEQRLWSAADTFEKLGAAFASITYGAGGSTRDRTIRITGQMHHHTSLMPIAHLTAVGHTREELEEMCDAYVEQGITNILALRGDPPGDPLGEWVQHPGGLLYASELVELIRQRGDFHVGVASFPEGHYRADSLAQDTDVLVHKLRAGAEYSITQMFFNIEDYLRLRDRVAAADPVQGEKPIIPGLMPITSLASVRRMVELSGSSLPTNLEQALEKAANGDEKKNRAEIRKVGIEYATKLCEGLIEEGAPCLHFCTLNWATATLEVLENLGMSSPKA